MKLLSQTAPKHSVGGFAGLTGLGAIFRRLFPGWNRRSAAGGAMEHLASLPLTAQSTLALIRVYDQQLLLGVTPANITLIATANGPDATTKNKTASGSTAVEKALLPSEGAVR